MTGASFETIVNSMGNNTGIVVPPEIIDALEAGKRPAVSVDLNGYRYRSTVGVMGGRYLISISSAIRKATGLKGGDPIKVHLTLAEGPREVAIPPDFAEALQKNPDAGAFFAKLPNSLQRYHVENITSAKAEETRRRRIDRAIALFLEGKQR